MTAPCARFPGALQTVSPIGIYRRLLKVYGPQGWWPVTVGADARPRYRPGFHGRLTERQAWEVCVGAIMTQNTAWGNVEKALRALHEAGVRSPQAVLDAPSAKLERLIRPSGYFRRKAVKLKALARHLRGRGGRVVAWLNGGAQADRRQELLGIYGIGPETADSMLLYACARPAFVVDAYTRRIGERLGWYKAATYDCAQRFLVGSLASDPVLYNECHALLVALAKNHCRKTPACSGCPLQEVCLHGLSG